MPIPEGYTPVSDKTIFVIGPEASGSRLIARHVAHAHGIHGWGGHAWACGPFACILHCSLPYTKHRHWLDVETCRQRYPNRRWILCTRDATCSASSSIQSKWTPQERAENRNMASIMMNSLLLSDERTYVWSYETFMLLGKPYFMDLCKFLDIETHGIFTLTDGNKKYMKGQ